MQRIGIIGSGTVGQALGTGFIKYGHEVKIGTRNFLKLKEWKSDAGKLASVGSFTEAAEYGDIVVLACKGSAAEEILKIVGKDSINGKIVIDATNPIADAPPENGVLKYFTEINKSLMEKLQETCPGSHFVKSFNMIGSHLMVNPYFGDEKPTMFICGNNENAKKTVVNILEQFGFEIEDMGGAEAARAIEPLAMLWCIPGFRENKWTHAFRLLKH